ncbi:unnamed protein product [Lymnaea stagnalis]|uniref:C2H2-type domain-containing protein n=1 Tax=Lymnaea stagnalis TaxID=6523 RepID=A0AAV2HBB7_LYMST
MERRRIRRKQGNTHISLAAIKQYLLYGTYPSGSTPSDKRSVRKRAESFKIEDGELYYIVRPKRVEGEPLDQNPGANKANLRKAIITPKNQLSVASLVHVQGGGTHMGTERTFSALSSKYYWVGMANTVRKVLKNCVICLANRPALSKVRPPSAQSNSFAQVSEELSMHNNNEMVAEKQELYKEPDHHVSKPDEAPEVMQYIVTAELPQPEQVDSDLDFDPNCAVTDAVFNPRSDFDIAHRFWQKVEIQILGPFAYKKKRSVYVIASLDSFSKWPETCRLDKINEKTVSQFCLKLIARYGVMEQLIILENDVTKMQAVDPGGICHNLHLYNVFISKESVNPMDESWNRLVENVQRFVGLYPDLWFDCLDVCLIPLRNSLARNADFTPSFLLMGREPTFPDSVLHGKDSEDAEVELSQKQIEQSVDTAMSHYVHCTIPDIKRVLPIPIHESKEEAEAAADKATPVRKSLRKSKKFHRLAGFDDDDDDEADEDSGASDNNPGLQNGHSIKKVQNVETVLTKKLSKSPESNKKNDDVQDQRAVNPSIETEHLDETLEKMDLDTHYKIIYFYKKDGIYPETCDATLKRSLGKVSDNFVLENGDLMYRQKGKLKRVVMKMEDRLKVMSESHIANGEHVSIAKVQEELESRNLFWKGLHLDIRAFVSACPKCKHGESRKRRRASKKALRWLRGVEEEEDSDDELNASGDLGKVTIEELVDFLKKDITPDSLSRSELLTFRKKAKNFKIEKGVLYYWPGKRCDLKPRKVLKTEKEQQEALKKAHGDNHVDKAGMMEALKKPCFWLSMSKDVDQFLAGCCQTESADEDGERKDELRLKLFQDYFAGKNICSKQSSAEKSFLKRALSFYTEYPLAQPKQDLVAAAMESAQLTTNTLKSPEHIATDESWDARGTESSNSVVPNTNASGGCDQKLSSDQPAEGVQDGQAPKPNENVAKIEMKEEGEDEDEEIDEEDKDELWKPDHSDTEKSATPGVHSAVKTINIRRRCEICQEVIRGDNNFKEHMYKHTGVKPFNCGQCHKMFTSIKGLKMHSRKHTGHRPYLCNICGRGFPRSASLRYHIKTHDKGGGVPVACDICHRTFTTENRMQKHKRFKHPAQAPVYMCETCGKVFTAKRSLKRHEEAHQGIRKYECQYCKRSFFRKEYLNYHLVSHSDEDPSLANYKMKGKFKRSVGTQKKREFPTELSIVCLDPSAMEVAQDQEVYSQLIEDANQQDWPEVHGERTIVYGLEGSQRVEEVDPEGGTTMVMMEEQPNSHGVVEVRHIIMPGDDHKQGQPMNIHHQQPTQDQARGIEVTLPTFTLPSGGHLQAIETGQDSVQYHVECLPGETLTEADIQAIQMLAQASLGPRMMSQ